MINQEINSGIPYWELEKYFKNEGITISERHFQLANCTVTLSLPQQQQWLQRTTITFSGDQVAIDQTIHKFRQAFLRGGG